MKQEFNNSFFSWDTLKRFLISTISFGITLYLVGVMCYAIESVGNPGIQIWQEAAKFTLQILTLCSAIVLLIKMLPSSFNKYEVTNGYLILQEYTILGKVVDMSINLQHITKVKIDASKRWDYHVRHRIIIYVNGASMRLNAFTHKQELYDYLYKVTNK